MAIEIDQFEDLSATVRPDVQVDPGHLTFGGYVDFYGYHPAAGGWFFEGWISHPWPFGFRPINFIADFSDVSLDGPMHAMFFHRADVSGFGIGFVIFIASNVVPEKQLVALRFELATIERTIIPTADVQLLAGVQLVDHFQGRTAGGEEGSQRRKLQLLLIGEPPRARASGFIDFYGYHSASASWMFCGWLDRGWPAGSTPDCIVLSFEEGDVSGEAFAVLHPRPDLRDGAVGVVFAVRASATPLGTLCSVNFECGTLHTTMSLGPGAPRVREPELVSRMRPVLGQAMPSKTREILSALLARRPYSGEDTLGALDTALFLEIDENIPCGPDGLILIGWYQARPGEVRAIRLRSGPLICEIDPQDWIRIERPDVLAGVAAHGFDDPRCGFITYLPNAISPDAQAYIEVETSRHEVAYRNLPRPKLHGLAAITHLLAVVNVRFAEVAPAFDRVLGPAVEALNRSRLGHRPRVTVVDYGVLPAAPEYSVIVPLFGRLDFVEYQLALFSAHPACGAIEFIYVLDDPARRLEAQVLFNSVYQRFLVPFRALMLDRNMGYAPANNIGLGHARGNFVAFLNSDVFPGTLDWVERLVTRLRENPTVGAIGPVLLFEDGSVQHRGMRFERLAEFGNWWFPQHVGKGLRYRAAGGVERAISITGACMVLRRALAERAGGFDETYVIGDLEDSDLCLRLAAMGYECAIDPGVQLYHLERKSQASAAVGWRMNLTVYNAWQHERRWGETIAALQTS